MDDFFNPPTDSDPASDFLAREKAALGDSFTAPGAGDSLEFDQDYEQSASQFPDLDGGDDDFLSGNSSGVNGSGPPTANAASNGLGTNSRGNAQLQTNDDNNFSAFESDYPEVELPSSQQPQQQQNDAFGSSAPQQLNSSQPQQPTSSQPVFSAPQPNLEESEFIKSWKTKQAEEIARREETSAAKREETIVKAQNAIDNFYKEYNQKKEKSIAANKEEEIKFNSDRQESLAKGTTWERICNLIDLVDSRSKTSTQSKQDLTRFKEVLLSLKREGENAPGAAGY